MQNPTVQSKIVEEDDVHENVVDELIDQMGELPNYFDVQVIVTVIVTPLPDDPDYLEGGRKN